MTNKMTLEQFKLLSFVDQLRELKETMKKVKIGVDAGEKTVNMSSWTEKVEIREKNICGTSCCIIGYQVCELVRLEELDVMEIDQELDIFCSEIADLAWQNNAQEQKTNLFRSVWRSSHRTRNMYAEDSNLFSVEELNSLVHLNKNDDIDGIIEYLQVCIDKVIEHKL